MTVIQAFRQLRQEDHESKVNLGSSGPHMEILFETRANTLTPAYPVCHIAKLATVESSKELSAVLS